jgi:hypothetical protein
MPRTCGASAFLGPRSRCGRDPDRGSSVPCAAMHEALGMTSSESRFPPRNQIRGRLFRDMRYPPGDGASEGASEGTRRLFSRRVGTAR